MKVYWQYGFVCLALVGLMGCGEGKVKVTNSSYQPRLVIQGLLIPGQPVEQIHISTNFRLNANLRATNLLLPEAQVAIVEEATGQRYPLVFEANLDFHRSFFAYRDVPELVIRPGQTYALEVSAQVEGQMLTARATTTVPQAGFDIAGISHESLAYRQQDEDGEVIDVEVAIQRSPGTTFYLLTAVPLTPSSESFVYDNPFTDEKADDLDLDDFDYGWEWIQNAPREAGVSLMQIFWWDVWFYGRHEIVVYAADQNWARFLQTFDDVQEDDGNFHAPLFDFEGEGIGYFGSALVDTVYLEITL